MRRESLLTEIKRHPGQTWPRAIRRFAPGQQTSVAIGVFDRDGPKYCVRLTATRWYPVVQSTLRLAARKAGLDATVWELPASRDDDAVAAAYEPARKTDDPAAVAAWIVERILELEAHGLLVDLDGNGQKL